MWDFVTNLVLLAGGAAASLVVFLGILLLFGLATTGFVAALIHVLDRMTRH